MGYIREYYEAIVKLREEEWQFIASFFSRTDLKKGDIVTKYGEIENFLSFIETGVVRYYIPGADQEITFNFSFDKEFTCAYDSFLTQKKVYSRTSVGNYLGRFSAEQLYLKKSKRELSLLTLTAKERYLQLFDDHPLLLEKVALKYIASYIGITPQALSRIRKQIC